MLTAERLREVLDYDPETGLFRWKIKTSGRCSKGWFRGSRHNQGYTVICVDCRVYLAHRLAWLWVHGDWAPNDTDHINGVRDDNRIINLRLATRSENNANSNARICNKLGIKGVHYSVERKKFVAAIRYKGKVFPLGRFLTLEEAKTAYNEAAIEYFGDFARLKP